MVGLADEDNKSDMPLKHAQVDERKQIRNKKIQDVPIGLSAPFLWPAAGESGQSSPGTAWPRLAIL
jgi:hypothetical protein